MSESGQFCLLITGAAGGIAQLLRPRLRCPGRTLRLLDRRQIQQVGPDEQVHPGHLGDPVALRAACAGVDAILHLGGEPTEAPWPNIVSANMDGTVNLLQAAVDSGVRRVILASSNHAVGLLPGDMAPVPADDGYRPDSFYGVSKAVVEMLGLLFHQRHGLDVSCLRIGRCVTQPKSPRNLENWLSPDDAARLVEVCLRTEPAAHRIVWAVSANTRGRFDLEPGYRIGYRPRDDSERFAAEVIAQAGGPGNEAADELIGGPFTRRPLGVRPH